MENTELETAVKVSDDKTSKNDIAIEPTIEQFNQIKAELELAKNNLAKANAIADRKTRQLDNLKSQINSSEKEEDNSTNVEQVVSTPLPQEETKSELEQVKEQLFRVQHPEITNEDMGVLKSFNGSLEENYNNPAFKAYMGNVLQERANQQATILRESGVNVASSLNDELNSATDNGNLTEYVLTNADKFFK